MRVEISLETGAWDEVTAVVRWDEPSYIYSDKSKEDNSPKCKVTYKAELKDKCKDNIRDLSDQDDWESFKLSQEAMEKMVKAVSEIVEYYCKVDDGEVEW